MTRTLPAGRRLTRRLWLSSVALGVGFGCAGRGRGASSPPPPRVPGDVLPGDLDLVLRLDLATIRAELGEETLRQLLQRWERAARAGDAEGGEWLVAAVERATIAWLALRPGAPGAGLDHVLLLRGRFAGLEPSAAAGSDTWGPPRPLGGGWRRHDALAPMTRGTPARLYLRDSSVILLVTPAELDAVERTLEAGLPRDARLGPPLPPTHGTFAAAARSRALAPWVTPWQPELGRLLGAARRVGLVVELADGGLRAEAELAFAAGEAALPGELAAAEATAAELFRLRDSLRALPGSAANWARGLTVRAEEGSVLARLEIEAAELDQALGGRGPRPGARGSAVSDPLSPP